MASEDYTHEGLTVVVRERPDQGTVEYGVDIDGAFLPIGGAKLSDFQEKILEAGKAAADEAESKSSSKSSSSK